MKLTVGGKLLAYSVTGSALLLAVALGGYRAVSRVAHAMDEITVTAAALRTHVEADMMHDALRADVLAAMLAATDAEREQVKADVAEHSGRFRACLRENGERPLGPAVKKALAEAAPMLDQYIESAESLVAVAVKDPEAAKRELPEFLGVFGRLETGMENLSDVVQASSEQTGAQAHLLVGSSKLLVAGLSAGGLAGLMVGAWLIARSVAAPLRCCVGVLTHLAAGDLTKRIDLNRSDELGELSRSADTMAQSVALVVREIKGASEEVVAAAAQISASSQALLQGVEEQAGQMAQTTAAVEEMTASVVEVAQQSSVAAQTASRSGASAREGGRVVGRTVEDMRAISMTFDESASLINELGRRGEEIGRIVAVIDDIADQTNLLALNAAIEAARAGAHGRGFAIVADEVRKLADRTTAATTEIAESIKAMQSQTRRAVEQTQSGSARVRQGAEEAFEAGASLGQIVEGATQVAGMIASIAAAAEEQGATSERIAASVREMNQVMEMSRARADESASCAGALTGKAEHLRAVVRRFKIED